MPSSSRPPFRRLTPELLRQLPDSELPYAVQDYVFIQIGDETEREADVLASLPPGVVAVYAALILDAEVGNGGFNQFFWNSPHRRVKQALDGLEFLKAAEHAELLRQAMSVATAEHERLLPYHVEGSIGAFSGSYREGVFDDLDTRYYGLPSLPDILARVIRQHPERFCPR
jgi:hypothetical protein